MEGGVTPFSSGMAPSGSYILIVVSQPLTEEHKQIILQRLDKGLLSWDVSSTGCDLSGLEYAFSSIIKERVIEGDVLIQHSTESLGVEVLLSPTVRTLKQCVKNLLSTPTSHKQLIHAGYTFAGSGSWIVENGTFSFDEFLELFQQANVASQKRCTINVHCAEEGEWNQKSFASEVFTKVADIALNPPAKVNHVPGSEHLIKCLDNALVTQSLEEMMKPSPLVGNIRFNRPTIYMFPAGQGDCALFGVNGFNMLIDGGFHRKPCSWDFVRHLDRLDAVLVTRIGESNVCGMSTLMKRNALNNANPQIGYVFCNVAENKPEAQKDINKVTKDDLIVSVVEEGHKFVQTLNDLKLKPHQCWRDSSVDPFVLYHKVGQGTLEMHVLSPPRDSKEMKLFLSEWNSYKETFSCVKSELKGQQSTVPLSHATSICAILVWRPEDPKDTITRILFPGSAPQNKILEGLEKLKTLNILNYPVVTKMSLNSMPSKNFNNKVEKISKSSIPNRNNTASPALSVSSIASKNGDIGGLKKETKESKRIVKDVKRESKEIKKEVKKEVRRDVVKEVKKEIKSEAVLKKESITKKESPKDVKKENKDVKKIVKKDNKEIKAVIEKKTDTKSTPKREISTPTTKSIVEVKKTSTTAKKSTTPIKKDAGKPPAAPKVSDTKKPISKISEPKLSKDNSNKKTTENKTVAKAKPKASSAAAPKTIPKTKPVSVPKPGSKMTKAVAASSIVASAVAVTAAAVELNEKKDDIEDAEPEISEKEEEINLELKDVPANEKPVDDHVSPLPPEALSPTPSESVSLTPSDTLSSAPLETVSPTPPLPNEPISTEEKDVNEIKDIEQDMPYETEPLAEEVEIPGNEINDIESELAKHKASADVMSTSFIGDKQLGDNEVEEGFYKTEIKDNESAPFKTNLESDDKISEKVVEREQMDEKDNDDISEEKYVNEKDVKERDIAEDDDIIREKDVIEEKNVVEKEDIVGEKDVIEEKNIVEEKDIIEEQNIVEEKDIVEGQRQNIVEVKDIVEEKDIADGQNIVEVKDIVERQNITDEQDTVEKQDAIDEKEIVENIEKKEIENIDEKETEETEEKDVTEEKEVHEKSITDDKSYGENKKEEGINEKSIDDQLAGLTMEGSFCADMMPSEEVSASNYAQVHGVSGDLDITDNYNCGENIEQEYEKKTVIESRSYLQTETFDSSAALSNENVIHDTAESHTADENDKYTADATAHYEEQNLKEYEAATNISQHLYETEKINHKMDETENYTYDLLQSEKQESNEVLDQQVDDESNEIGFDKLSHIQSMEASFHQETYQHYDHPTNFDDPEMQETSVDDPEEMERKESIVSITLNDENAEDNYIDKWRRKSGTESEDDVDIGKYMAKEQTVDEEKLHIQQESDSDEDVVKSPTPHAVVDYEGQLDQLTSMTKHDAESEGDENEQLYSNEKQDFDEKDRDSAEEHDTDDGEMIRHPTPPEMKYSEEEMRDPIGQHFITNPNLKAQGSDITEQPLYEEAEDSESERSASPIVEQPIFGSTAEADFPELVTVSGGTTPSEPQSPKSGFDAKKFATEAAVMEALSEHDISDSSTHSPSCQDGSTAFELQTSERSVIDVQSLQDVSQEEHIIEATIENNEIKSDASLQNNTNIEDDKVDQIEKLSSTEVVLHDDDDQEEKQETPSDEDESSSEDENSESHSKDKSDAMGDKSDVERDDKSDIHNDDRSDHHYDEKPDAVNDNETDKSDIHEDDQMYQQDKLMDHESVFESHDNMNFYNKDNLDMHFDTADYPQKENACLDESLLQNQNENSDVYEQNASSFKDVDDVQNTGKYDLHFTENFPAESSHVDDSACTDDSHKDITNAELISNNELTEPGKDLVEPENSNKQEHDIENDGERSYTFQSTEVYSENNESIVGFSGINTFDSEDKGETTAELNSQVCEDDASKYSQEVPYGFGNAQNVSVEQFDDELYQGQENLQDVSLQHSENVMIVENKVLSETTEAQQYENLSQYEKNMHISNETYSENALIKDVTLDSTTNEAHVISSERVDIKEVNFKYANSEIKSFTTTTTTSSNAFDGHIDNDDEDDLYDKTGGVTEFDDKSGLEYSVPKNVDNFNVEDLTRSEENYLHSYDHEELTQDKDHMLESHSVTKMSAEVISSLNDQNPEEISENGFSSQIADLNFNDNENAHPETKSTPFAVVNGKDQPDFSIKSSEITEEFIKTELSQKEVVNVTTQQMEQESSYLINERFHSDSPEDNTMRSDSSPDVPYPVDLTDKFSEIKNSLSVETCSETYSHNSEDYKNNINFTSTDDVPPSPQNHSLNANRNAYTESSEDEGNLVHGNVSSYAYTNKAYAREEEDIDGNHIYKEETTEVIKQMEFDGNNLQSFNTNQVSSVLSYSQEYQDGQFSTGANYDFHLEDWGKPMGLPTPPDGSQKTLSKKVEKSAVKSKTNIDANGKIHSPSVSTKLSSPLKKSKPKVAKESSSSPVYVDLAYVPQHADPQYCDVEFFKKIRARYYVFSSVNPSKEVLNALLEAKKTWNEDLSVTIIPTFETDTLGYWMAQNQNDLAEYSIDISPSASRCTVNLQDHQTSCSAYRLEF